MVRPGVKNHYYFHYHHHHIWFEYLHEQIQIQYGFLHLFYNTGQDVNEQLSLIIEKLMYRITFYNYFTSFLFLTGW